MKTLHKKGSPVGTQDLLIAVLNFTAKMLAYGHKGVYSAIPAESKSSEIIFNVYSKCVGKYSESPLRK